MTVTEPIHDSISIHQLTGSIGAELAGVNLKALDDAQFAIIKSALHDHLMLVFRDPVSYTHLTLPTKLEV